MDDPQATKPKPQPPTAAAPRTDGDKRVEREAAALRQNLIRRKQQARARQARRTDPSQT